MKKILFCVALMATGFFGVAQVGVGTTNPHASAVLDVESTTKGFLPPRMTQAQINSIVNPAEGLLVYCLDCTIKDLYVNDGTGFVSLTFGGAIYLTTVVDVAGQNGTVWMDRNLGAKQAATSRSDAAAYGDLYQWGRRADGHQIRNSATTTGQLNFGSQSSKFVLSSNDWLSASDDTLWQAGKNDPCPTGYRIPTETELDAERTSFATSNAEGAYGSALKLTLAGYREGTNGELDSEGSYGGYWSYTHSGSNPSILSFNISNVSISTGYRSEGYSVRCIKIK